MATCITGSLSDRGAQIGLVGKCSRTFSLYCLSSSSLYDSKPFFRSDSCATAATPSARPAERKTSLTVITMFLMSTTESCSVLRFGKSLRRLGADRCRVARDSREDNNQTGSIPRRSQLYKTLCSKTQKVSVVDARRNLVSSIFCGDLVGPHFGDSSRSSWCARLVC